MSRSMLSQKANLSYRSKGPQMGLNGLSRREFFGGVGGSVAALATAVAMEEKAKSQSKNQARHPLKLGRIESVSNEPRIVVVETTGAVFKFYRSDPARIEVTQKINGPRDVCSMQWKISFADLTIDFHDENQFVSYVPVSDVGFNIRIFGDSLLSIRSGRTVEVRTSGRWVPEYSYSQAGYLLFLDKLGGYGQYLLPYTEATAGAVEEARPGLSFASRGWETYFELPEGRTMLACVAPPRPFDFRSSVQDRIVHHLLGGKRRDGTWDFFPSDETIQGYARYGNVLILHVWQKGAGPFQGNEISSRAEWYGKSAMWATWRYEPLDEGELNRVVGTAHGLGMYVLPYMSPAYFPGNAQEFLLELKRVLEAYAFDGVYYDGTSQDILHAYDVMKGTREVLGEDRLLYVHVPSPILGSPGSYTQGRYVYCPFIDTYANFILRSEHIDSFDDDTLRYTISGYNISNAVGFVCNYDYDLEFNRELIRKALDYQVRVPFWVGWDIYLTDLSKLTGKKYPSMATVHEIMARDYFPTLDRLREKWRGGSFE